MLAEPTTCGTPYLVVYLYQILCGHWSVAGGCATADGTAGGVWVRMKEHDVPAPLQVVYNEGVGGGGHYYTQQISVVPPVMTTLEQVRSA